MPTRHGSWCSRSNAYSCRVDETSPDVVVCVVGSRTSADGVLASSAGTPVVIVGPGEPSVVAYAVRAGASGYVCHDDSEEILSTTIAAVAAGRSIYPRQWREVGPQTATTHLTPRERDVLALIVGCQSNKQIARTLGIAEQTVKRAKGKDGRCGQTARSSRLPRSRTENAAKISATPKKIAHTPTSVTNVSSDRSQ